MGDRRRHPDDVGDRIIGADLVKRDAIEPRSVQRRLDLGDPGEDVRRERPSIGIEARARQKAFHLRVVTVLVGAPASGLARACARVAVRVCVNVRVRLVVVFVVVIVGVRARVAVSVVVVHAGAALTGPRDLEATSQVSAALPPPESDPQPAHPHGVHRALDDGGRDAEIDERRDRHVAGDTRRRLEMQMESGAGAGWHPHGSRFRFSIAARRPAPNPLSMLTTAMPAAHELSIDSSAATPPRLAP